MYSLFPRSRHTRQAVSNFVVLEPRGADTLMTVAAIVDFGGDIPVSVVNSRLGEMAGVFQSLESLGQVRGFVCFPFSPSPSPSPSLSLSLSLSLCLSLSLSLFLSMYACVCVCVCVCACVFGDCSWSPTGWHGMAWSYILMRRPASVHAETGPED